ncbi:MAG: alanine racemase [Nitrospiraceae bacterium]|nr:alanine racemase [Nitrospiraceae bacterium]
MERGQEAKIDLKALRHNLRAVKSLAGGAVIAVVKADAYGHGAVPVSKTLEKEGVFALAVAYASEARVLRQAGIKSTVLVLFDEEPEPCFDLDLVPVIHSLRSARRLSREARKRGRQIDVHVKADTGMGRMGLCADVCARDILQIASLPGLRLQGLMSHISEAHPGGLDFARLQLERFGSLRRELAAKGMKPFAHISSSASALLLPEAAMDALRVGLLLYGACPFEARGPDGHLPDKGFNLKPVMEVRTRIMLVKRFGKGQPVGYDRTFVTPRRSNIAVIPVGYADGYSRAFSNRASALVRGQRAAVAGRVCMDVTMLDVTGIRGVSEGDEVVLLGGGLSSRELAGWAGTNPYEVMTSLGGGARRRFE